MALAVAAVAMPGAMAQVSFRHGSAKTLINP